jgi:hypothetical protein
MRYRCPICSFEFIGGGFCPSPYHVATMMVELPEQEDNRERNEPTLRGVCELTINNCDGCDNKIGTPCKVTFDLYKCAKRQLGDLIADGNYVAAIELYNQIREKLK